MQTQVLLSLLTGVAVGGLFKFIDVPIPAPPNLAGVVGIVGIYLGYKLMGWLGYTVDLSNLLAGLV
jgi:XapX domain-containing protein